MHYVSNPMIWTIAIFINISLRTNFNPYKRISQNVLSNGYIQIVREPENRQIVFCKNTKGDVTSTVKYSECYGTTTRMERSVNLNTGIFTGNNSYSEQNLMEGCLGLMWSLTMQM